VTIFVASWQARQQHRLRACYDPSDRTTHLKIVVVGLAAALMIAVMGISVRDLNLGTDIMTAQTPTVIKAGGPVLFTDRSGPIVR
jgi:hypothetical protein